MKTHIIMTALLALVALTTFGQGNIADTYWRNEQTGDWLIGFAEKHVIYNNKVWEIVSQMEKKDGYTLTVDNGDVIKVGKMKNGLRSIAIGKGKAVVCSQITTATLPEYPMEDLTPFKDNGYRAGDTATIVGWLKDCPKEVLDQNREFDIEATSLFSHGNFNAYGRIDSLGRFTVKMPVENTQEAYMDWGRTTLPIVLEPGETYFYLCDYKTGQRLIMGSNARMQNEQLTYASVSLFGLEHAEHPGNSYMTAEQVIDYKNRLAAMYERNCAWLDSFFTQHPTLSRRYEDYLRMTNLTHVGEMMMQATFNTGSSLPAEVVSYVDSLVWPNVPKPYTLSRQFCWFIYYYQINAENGNPKMQKRVLLPEWFLGMESGGKLSLSQAERELMALWQQSNADYEKATNPSETEALNKKYASMLKQLRVFIEKDRIKEFIKANMPDPLEIIAEMADSIYTDPLLRDVGKARSLYRQIDEKRAPLTDRQMAIVDQIQTPAARQCVLTHNDKYLALQQRAVEGVQSLKANDGLAGMSDGEKILRKITEPYRGRLILLDVWGTWCGPCKDALSNSKEEFERLKDFGLVYLYLANNSSDESWKNVIKEYDLTGDDIVHYNLPTDQQSAVEHFLNVHAFPTYKLINRDGTVLDVNADPRDLESLARLLEKLK